jgi:hypothetical protein
MVFTSFDVAVAAPMTRGRNRSSRLLLSTDDPKLWTIRLSVERLPRLAAARTVGGRASRAAR